MLTIRGRQRYEDQEPDVIELVTDGTLEVCDDGWELRYEESGLTGMEGVITCFRLRPGQVMLERTGKIQSRMVFEEGASHNSLYNMEFGTMMITVTATAVRYEIGAAGGTVDLSYRIVIEKSAEGLVDYHLDIRKKV